MNPHKLPFNMLNFPRMKTFGLRSMRTGLQSTASKNAKIGLVETSLKYQKTEQQSFTRFLQCFFDQRLYQVAESGQPRPHRIFSLQEEGEIFFKKLSGDEVESQGVFVAKILPFQPFPYNFPDLRLRILGNQERSGKSQNYVEL